jgi:hypothetical protein
MHGCCDAETFGIVLYELQLVLILFFNKRRRPFKHSLALNRKLSGGSKMDAKYKEHKHPFFGDLPLSTSGPLDCALTGLALLRNPYFNKGSAFSAEERTTFELHGLLPTNVQNLEEQVKRAYHQYSTRENDLAKNTFMTSLRMQNEILFYRVGVAFAFVN